MRLSNITLSIRLTESLFINSILSSLFFIGCINPPIEDSFELAEKRTIISVEEVDETDKLLDAIIWVESQGNDSAIGDGGLAVGCLQMHPIAVREVNRLIKNDEYTLEDRYDRSKSIEMFNIIRWHTRNKSYEKLARNWNGGSNGYKKKSTLRYWNLVLKQLHSHK